MIIIVTIKIIIITIIVTIQIIFITIIIIVIVTVKIIIPQLICVSLCFDVSSAQAHAFYRLTSNGERRHIIEALMIDQPRKKQIKTKRQPSLLALLWFGIIEALMVDQIRAWHNFNANDGTDKNSIETKGSMCIKL